MTQRLKLLITGAGGQLGRALSRRLRVEHEIIIVDRTQLDITNTINCRATIETLQPDVILNCAAYTAVDKAESERDAAFATNALAPGYLAQAAHATGALLIHFSTDYVFDGIAHRINNLPRPYLETDSPHPNGVYAESKLAGERAVLEHTRDAFIFRLSWVYSNEGANFYKTMLRLAHERDYLRVVADQFGTPNFCSDIADAIAHVFTYERAQLQQKAGLYHLSAGDVTTWHGFASEIMRTAKLERIPTVEAITTKEYPTPAQRPAYSALDARLFAQTFEWALPTWQAGLARCLAERAASA